MPVKPQDIGWYPRDPNFRKRYEDAMRAALHHFAKYGDVTQVQQLLHLITDRETLFTIARSVAAQFPIRLDRNGKLSSDKDRARTFDWAAIDTAVFWPRRIHSDGESIFLRNEEFSITELIDEVIDVLVLHRHRLADGDFERLQNAVHAVAERRRSKSVPGLSSEPAIKE